MKYILVLLYTDKHLSLDQIFLPIAYHCFSQYGESLPKNLCKNILNVWYTLQYIGRVDKLLMYNDLEKLYKAKIAYLLSV